MNRKEKITAQAVAFKNRIRNGFILVNTYKGETKEVEYYLGSQLGVGVYKNRTISWLVDNEPEYMVFLLDTVCFKMFPLFFEYLSGSKGFQKYLKKLEKTPAINTGFTLASTGTFNMPVTYDLDTWVEFGKYRNKTIKWVADNDASYLLWLIKKDGINVSYQFINYLCKDSEWTVVRMRDGEYIYIKNSPLLYRKYKNKTK